MKIRTLYIALTAIIFAGCGNSAKQVEQVDTNEPVVEEVVTEVVEEGTSEGVSEHDKNRAISELKSWGASDAYFEDEYLCYVVSEPSLSATPYEVGKSLYPMFSDIQGIKGIKVVSAESKKTLATYPD